MLAQIVLGILIANEWGWRLAGPALRPAQVERRGADPDHSHPHLLSLGTPAAAAARRHSGDPAICRPRYALPALWPRSGAGVSRLDRDGCLSGACADLRPVQPAVDLAGEPCALRAAVWPFTRSLGSRSPWLRPCISARRCSTISCARIASSCAWSAADACCAKPRVVELTSAESARLDQRDLDPLPAARVDRAARSASAAQHRRGGGRRAHARDRGALGRGVRPLAAAGRSGRACRASMTGRPARCRCRSQASSRICASLPPRSCARCRRAISLIVNGHGGNRGVLENLLHELAATSGSMPALSIPSILPRSTAASQCPTCMAGGRNLGDARARARSRAPRAGGGVRPRCLTRSGR